MKKSEEIHARGISIDVQKVSCEDYAAFHRKRIDWTLKKLREIEAQKILELGSHPWVMTSALMDDPCFEVCATVSVEEQVDWPDDIGVRRETHQIRTMEANEVAFVNYSANVERKLFEIQETPDTVLACEIIEHLVRAPHMMLLNVNHWLPLGGKIFMTTPNGAQFSNPFRRKSPTPAYRSNIYERHSYVYTLNDLVELVTLSGFRVSEAGYWDDYERTGLAKVYGILSHIPLRYFKDKFKKMIYLVGVKEREVTELERCPKVYDSRGDWEFIKKG